MKPRALTNTVQEIHSIRDILKAISYDTTVIWDLDNTMQEAIHELGSDQWFRAMISLACDQIPDSNEACTLVCAVYHEVQHKTYTQAVEQVVVKINQFLRASGIHQEAITARSDFLKATTFRQLGENGIHFHEDEITFCGGKNKGEMYRLKLLNSRERPKHIIMIDDSLKHVQDMANAAREFGIPFTGFHYRHLDQKVSTLDMDNANYQLALIKHALPEETQTHIARLSLPHSVPPKLDAREFRFFSVNIPQRDSAPAPYEFEQYYQKQTN